MLEHMVDVVLYFEGSVLINSVYYGLLKTVLVLHQKQVFFCHGRGRVTRIIQSICFSLGRRSDEESGSAVMIYLEGVRPLLVEVQSLVVTTAFGMP